MAAVDEPEEEKRSGKCIHRLEHNCTLTEAQKLIAGTGEDCNEKCCWNCTRHGSCSFECNTSAQRPEECCQPAAGIPDERQQDDFVEDAKIEERIVEPNKTSDHSGDITEMTSADSSKISIQPPLPVMKNADQRKEWLRNYKEWGLWYTDEHIGARYYKYDFENGTRLIVEEYDPEPARNSPWAPYEPYYMHLVGGPEPERNNGIPKWTYHSKYNKYPNSETELVEFLKGVQK